MNIIKTFIDYIVYEKRYSPGTAILYKNTLEDFSEFLASEGIKDIGLASRKQIKPYIYFLVESGLAPRTVNNKLTTLKSFYGFLYRKEIRSDNPTLTFMMLRTGSRLPYFVDAHDLNRLLDDLEFMPGFVGSRDRTILEILYGTGIRVGELTRIKEFHFSPYSKQIKILGKGSKERIVPLYPELIIKIEEYIKVKRQAFPESDHLILGDKGAPASIKRIEQIVKKYLSLVTEIPRRGPHVLRHSFATHLLNNDAPIAAIKDLLGHEHLKETQIYTHTAVEKIIRDHKKAHPKG